MTSDSRTTELALSGMAREGKQGSLQDRGDICRLWHGHVCTAHAAFAATVLAGMFF